MLLSSYQVAQASEAVQEEWILRYEGARSRIILIARGYATGPRSEETCQRLVELLGRRTVDVVVDLQAMTGYTSEARRAWQQGLYPARGQIRRILVLGRAIPPLIRMGVTVVAAFSGIPVRFFADMEALEAAERRQAG